MTEGGGQARQREVGGEKGKTQRVWVEWWWEDMGFGGSSGVCRRRRVEGEAVRGSDGKREVVRAVRG